METVTSTLDTSSDEVDRVAKLLLSRELPQAAAMLRALSADIEVLQIRAAVAEAMWDETKKERDRFRVALDAAGMALHKVAAIEEEAHYIDVLGRYTIGKVNFTTIQCVRKMIRAALVDGGKHD